MKRTPPFLRLLLALMLLFGLVGGSVIAFLQSKWLAGSLKQALIDGVYNATGARAEIPVFDWNWRTLTIEMRGFTMHGFEPASGPPLLTAPFIRVRLRILSLLDGNVQLSSLVVTRPRFFLTIGPHGSTNIPGPKHVISPREVIDTLLNLKLPHVEATHGFAQIGARTVPLDLVGDHVSLLIRYQPSDRRYHIALQSPALRLGGGQATYFVGAVETEAELWRDHFSLTASRFHSDSADVRLSGSLYEFNNPVIDWRLASTFVATENLRRFGIKGLEGGTLTLSGLGHHDPQTPLFFAGNFAADRLSTVIAGMPLRDGSIRSKLVVDTAGLELSDLVVSAPQGRFEGRAGLASSRNLTLSGTLSGIDLQSSASAFTHKPIPWSASAGGPVELTATLLPGLSNLIVQGTLNIAPRPLGIPVQGNIRYAFRQRESSLFIQEAHLRLPQSELTVSGDPASALQFAVDSSDLADLTPGLSLLGSPVSARALPNLAQGGSAHVEGTAHFDPGHAVRVEALLDAARLRWNGASVDHIRSRWSASSSQLEISSLLLESPLLQATASARASLSGWRVTSQSPLQAAGSFSKANIQSLLQLFEPQTGQSIVGGSASGSFALRGSFEAPQGTMNLSASNVKLHTEQLNSAAVTLELAGNQLTASGGQIHSGTAAILFSGVYLSGDSPQIGAPQQRWSSGKLRLAVDTNRFPLSRLRPLTSALQDVEGQTELHVRTTLSVVPNHISPLELKGTAVLRGILLKGIALGDLTASASTAGALIEGQLSGNFRGSKLIGNTQLRIAPGTPAKGSISFDAITLDTLRSILQPTQPPSAVLSGSARGDLYFDGPLETPEKLHGRLELRDLQVNGPPLRSLGEELTGGTTSPKTASEVILQSSSPVALELNNGIVSVRSARLTGRDTQLVVSGTAALTGTQPVQFALRGGIDLRLLQLLYPDVQVGGQSSIAAAVNGTLTDPQLSGSVQIVNASLFSPLAPNGLSDLAGVVRFDQHRATLEKVTAHTGGGLVSFGGFVTYSANHPLVYRLDSSGQNVRVRYANGISVTGNSQFSLTGTSEQSLLSGGITISRVVLNPNADLGNLLSLTSAPTVAVDNTKDYLSRLQMDIHIESAPNLQLDTALSSGVQAEISLQLRGTPKQPVFLGSIEANQGDIKVFGSRYSINRGQISFTNSARLEPVLDLDLQTQARGITVDITISGTLNKLNINYRSDPPLQPRDIIALLTVGRTPQTTASESNVQSTNDANSLQSGANSVLGQAISPVSNRLSKLFGITNIKIDPLVQGVTNTPQARLTLEQQISRQITVTYITNLSQTSEQIFRLEYSLNPQFSLIALRDDNGEFGIDILYKKRFK